MARNVEIKARVQHLDAIVAAVREIADQGPCDILQDDTFFHCQHGRLKLRKFSADKGELIYYQRPDQAGPKLSEYLIATTDAPDQLCEILSAACGQAGRIVKQRTLFLVGRTRVHLDRVQGLGEFVELEVVLDECETAEAGAAVARELLNRLGIRPEQLVSGAYIDLPSAARQDSSR
jgi:predicted adenylyl cyclase CyaB